MHILYVLLYDLNIRNIHLYFIKGKSGSELDNFAKLRTELKTLSWKRDGMWMVFLYFYGNYTRAQEKMTPRFQQLRQQLQLRFGNEPVTPELATAFRKGSLPLMKYANMLTFNTRAIVLYIVLLVGQPWLYFVFEIVVMNLLFIYMRSQHESLCKRLTNELQQGMY